MMAFFEAFHFLRPWWLLALIPAALLVLALWRRQHSENAWQHLIAPHLLPYLMDAEQIRRRRWPLLGLLALWVLGTLALAGPAWQQQPQPTAQSDTPLVIVWDLSPSMLARDMEPSRLGRSRLKITDLLNSRTEGQTALVAYSAHAHVVTPLTEDTANVINLLPALHPGMMPAPGSNAESALKLAITLLERVNAPRGDIVFVTDEIAPSAFDTLRYKLRRAPYQLTVWGVGTTEGAPIPLEQGGFARDNTGNIVVARLNEEALQQFTAESGSYYVPMVTNDSDIETLNQLFTPLASMDRKSDLMVERWFDHGQYLALLLLPFVLLLFRRGLVFAALLFVPLGLLPSQSAQALSWEGLWHNSEQRAQRRLAQGQTEAAEQFSHPQRRGAALHQQGQHERAAEAFAQAEGAEAAYNRGTALTHSGDYEQALTAFEQALNLRPDFPEAEHNRAIAEQLLEQQQQEQQEQDQDGDGENGDQQQDGEQDTQGDSESPEDQQGDRDNGQDQDGDSGPEDSEGHEDSSPTDPGQSPYQEALDEYEREQAEMEAGEQTAEQPHTLEELSQEEIERLEEEQLLEQMLRRVPDDPSGLLRNKFRHEHQQRQLEIRHQRPFSNEHNEQRW